MKKISVILLAVLLLFSLSTSAFAEGFVNSPSLEQAPTVESFESDSKDFKGELVITPYTGRDSLDAEGKKEFENAYNEIKTTTDITKLNADLAKLAEKKNIAGEFLAVSDLFNLDIKTDSKKDESGNFTIKLKVDVKNFVALLHNKNGAWELVDNATLKDGVLTFKVSDFSPFAIVVDTKATSPATGENNTMIWFALIAVASAALCAFCVIKSKKSVKE